MAAKKPAKIASSKKGKAAAKLCTECGGELSIAKILRDKGASGMYWLCTNSSCNHLTSTTGAPAGTLELR